MNAIKCLIVDDEPVARQIIESYVAKLQNIELVASCKNVSEAFEVLNSNDRHWDLQVQHVYTYI